MIHIDLVTDWINQAIIRLRMATANGFVGSHDGANFI